MEFKVTSVFLVVFVVTLEAYLISASPAPQSSEKLFLEVNPNTLILNTILKPLNVSVDQLQDLVETGKNDPFQLINKINTVFGNDLLSFRDGLFDIGFEAFRNIVKQTTDPYVKNIFKANFFMGLFVQSFIEEQIKFYYSFIKNALNVPSGLPSNTKLVRNKRDLAQFHEWFQKLPNFIESVHVETSRIITVVIERYYYPNLSTNYILSVLFQTVNYIVLRVVEVLSYVNAASYEVLILFGVIPAPLSTSREVRDVTSQCIIPPPFQAIVSDLLLRVNDFIRQLITNALVYVGALTGGVLNEFLQVAQAGLFQFLDSLLAFC